METVGSEIETLIDRVEDYSKTTLELAKLNSLQTTTSVVTSLLWRLSVIFILLLFVLIISIGMALFLGDLLGAVYYGFFIVAGFYLLTGLVMHFFLHNWIKNPISKLIITEALQVL